MESKTIVIRPSVDEYLSELIHILYEQEYFGFLSSAEKYIKDIYSFLEQDLPKLHRLNLCPKAKPYFSKYGENLHIAAYRRPKTKTTWYAFYEVFENKYFKIAYMTNSHTEDSIHISRIPLKP